MRRPASRHPRTHAPLLALALAFTLLLPALVFDPPVARAATITVNSTLDAVVADTNCTLREAIIAANTNVAANGCAAGSATGQDRITITATGSILLRNTLPAIISSVAIEGPGQANLTIRPLSTIDEVDRFPLVVVNIQASPGLAVGLSGLTLSGGRARDRDGSSYGGNLRSWAANLTLTDVALRDASGDVNASGAQGAAGGGAYISGGTSTLTRVLVDGNITPGSGAGLFIDDFYGITDVTIAGSTITGNQATVGSGVFSGSGGGLYVAQPSPSRTVAVRLTNTTIGTTARPNTARFGGGISNSGMLTVTNSTITGNTASGSGGIANSGTLIVTDSTITRNTATAGSGGIANSDGILTVTGSTISSNTAGTETGGILNFAGILNISTSTVSGNTARRGGGIRSYGAGGTLTVTDSTISGNTASESGGGIDTSNSATITNSTLSGNNAPIGGGIYQIGNTLTLTNSTVSGNSATDGGGGLLNRGGTATYLQSTIVGNTGGGVRAEETNTSNPTTRLRASVIGGNIGADCSTSSTTLAPLTTQGDNLVGPTCPLSPGSGGVGGDIALTGTLSTALDPTLADNGGTTAPPTRTHNIVTGGPAHDRIEVGRCAVTTDQRGVPRQQPATGKCDIGAVEYTAAPPSPSPTPTPSTIPSPSPTPTPTPSPSGPPPSFADVPVDYWAHDQIVQFAQRGITTGCDTDPAGVRYYCPERPVTRAEMAAFLIRTLTGQTTAPAGPATPTFSDVPANHPQYGYIEALVQLGITTGCGGGDYCPDREVTRAEMAAFIIRALTATTTAPPGPATATFGDVPPGHPQFGFIEAMFARKVTTGCGDTAARPRTYCPGSNVTRAEMAVFVIRAYP